MIIMRIWMTQGVLYLIQQSFEVCSHRCVALSRGALVWSHLEHCVLTCAHYLVQDGSHVETWPKNSNVSVLKIDLENSICSHYLVDVSGEDLIQTYQVLLTKMDLTLIDSCILHLLQGFRINTCRRVRIHAFSVTIAPFGNRLQARVLEVSTVSALGID